MPGPGCPTIDGEPRLEQRVRETARRGALSHAIVLSGPGDLPAAARFVAAAMECEGDGPPCGICGPCRKVLRDIHPDVVTVSDPEHKNISVEILRQVAADAYILPNEGRRKVYLFPDCALLDSKTQNVLLKVVEEGPPHAAFLFCARNSAVLLPTIRSRAVEWKLSAEGEDTAVPDAGARRLCELLCGGKAADIVSFCAELENSKLDREALRTMLSAARDLVSRALAVSYGAPGSAPARQLAEAAGRRQLAAWVEIFDQSSRDCQYNINVGQIAGALAVALIG